MGQVGEFRIIEQIVATLSKSATSAAEGAARDARIHVGIGDDAAVLESPKGKLLLCSDALVEGTHFRLEWTTPEELGHKALAAGLSDIAAMNGKPLYALVSLALRPGLNDDFVERLYKGIGQIANKYGVAIVGGDLLSSRSEVFIDISVAGESHAPITRAGARPGDLVAVSGVLGGSGAALAGLLAGLTRSSIAPCLLQAHFRPEPRFDILLPELKGLVTSMIDVSDGLASELHHLSRASGCVFEINENAVPRMPEALALAETLGASAEDWIWFGGEDYQLLMTLDPSVWAEITASRPELKRTIVIIGRTEIAGHGVFRVDESGNRSSVPDLGWNHFK